MVPRVKKIAISTTSFGQYDNSPLELCREKGFKVTTNPYGRKISSDELIALAKDAVGLIAGTENITSFELFRLVRLKVISRCGSGLDNVDLEVAKKLKIKVFNTPDAVTPAVAELALGLMLNLLRGISAQDRELHGGRWQKRMGSLLCGKKVGIIGFGKIGKKMAELLKPFACQIAYADPNVKDGLMGFRRCTLEELLGWSDIVSLHVCGSAKILGKKEFRLLKQGAWLINTSRGEVVDEQLLLQALREGRLSGCALDVFTQEPYTGSLRDLNNVILTPHIGSYAKEARLKMEKQAVKSLLKALED